MKRVVLLALAAAFVVPAGAPAAIPCRDRIYNEWYSSGKISTNYPLACYRDALTKIPLDAHIYSNLESDIRAALQAALAGRKDPVGHGYATVLSTTSETKGAHETQVEPHASSVAPPTGSPSSSNGVPVPILVLGAIALLLIASGAAGLGVKHYRRRSAS